ncbi:MAG: TRAP transporter small permease subunit [Spirochaetales bacterium]|nr:TRAP transporter small permease subunit [Spirochaetales bacterium]
MKKLKIVFDKLDFGMEKLEKGLASIMFAALFLVFIINVIYRYFFTAILWGHELSLLFFLWIAVFGCLYANRTDENIKFDSVYNNGSEMRKIIFDIIGSVLVVVLFSISFKPSLDYIIFMNFEMSDTLPFRKSVIFSVYMYFLVGIIFQYTRKLISSIKKLKALKNGGAES